MSSIVSHPTVNFGPSASKDDSLGLKFSVNALLAAKIVNIFCYSNLIIHQPLTHTQMKMKGTDGFGGNCGGRWQ